MSYFLPLMIDVQFERKIEEEEGKNFPQLSSIVVMEEDDGTEYFDVYSPFQWIEQSSLNNDLYLLIDFGISTNNELTGLILGYSTDNWDSNIMESTWEPKRIDIWEGGNLTMDDCEFQIGNPNHIKKFVDKLIKIMKKIRKENKKKERKEKEKTKKVKEEEEEHNENVDNDDDGEFVPKDDGEDSEDEEFLNEVNNWDKDQDLKELNE